MLAQNEGSFRHVSIFPYTSPSFRASFHLCIHLSRLSIHTYITATCHAVHVGLSYLETHRSFFCITIPQQLFDYVVAFAFSLTDTNLTHALLLAPPPSASLGPSTHCDAS
jgi:hypothetical protein